MTKAYYEAFELEPGLVELETSKVNFLRMDHFDAEKAAIRLAVYWFYRKEIFQERWLLPMNQTGKGALSMHDVELLRTGYTAIQLDPSQKDVFILVDNSRLPAWDNQSIERNVFYWFALFGQEMAQKGTRLLYAVSGASRPAMSVECQMWPIVNKAFKCKFKKVLLAKTYEEGR